VTTDVQVDPGSGGLNPEVDPVALARSLDLPGIFDVHTHFLPQAVMDKVWQVFDDAGSRYGVDWPIAYRLPEEERVELLRGWGVARFTALVYAHRTGMAGWLNTWAAEFAMAHPDCLSTATFFPEPGVADYVEEALAAGARVFKVHLQVSGFDPRDRVLRPVWGSLQDAAVPVVLHCGSGPIPGPFTGPGPVRDLLRSFPRLPLVIAHAGAPEYGEFLDLADEFAGVRIDTTMVFTDFMERLAPFPVGLRPRLLAAALRGDVLFGSDFPNISYRYGHALAALVRLDLAADPEWLRRVLWQSGLDLFG